MRILHLTWEYPPVIYGGLGRHVLALTQAQAALGHDVTVVTQRPAGTVPVERGDGVRVVRTAEVTPPVRRDVAGLMTWTADLDAHLAAAVLGPDFQPGPEQGPGPDVVHAHDWVVERAARAARRRWTAPLITTVHATEAGRHSGWISGEPSESIHAAEWRLTHLSSLVITCSTAMNEEVRHLFELPADRVTAVPNGIDLNAWQSSAAAPGSSPSQDPLIVFVGRLEWEKGVHVLIDAARRLPVSLGVRVVIAGTGTRADHLRTEAADDPSIDLIGPVSDDEVRRLYARAAAVVVPSLYEPFGIVALEAAALEAPLIVSDTGGLAEIVEDGRTGLVVPPGDAGALARAIGAVLTNPAGARRRATALAAELPERYSWHRIAERSVAAYEYARGLPAPAPGESTPPIPRGRLLTDR